MAFSANYIYCYIEQEKPIQMNLFLKNFINNCQRGAGVNIIHLAVGGDINYSYRVDGNSWARFNDVIVCDPLCQSLIK